MAWNGRHGFPPWAGRYGSGKWGSDDASVSTNIYTLAIVSGDNQTGEAGEELADDLVVLVTIDGVPQADITVTFTALAGSVDDVSVETDVDGLAAVAWTLGANPGAQGCRVTIEDGNSGTFTATAAIDGAVTYGGKYITYDGKYLVYG